MTPTPLESDILIWLSDNADDPLVAVQARFAKVVNRDYTGAGFFVTLQIPAEIERLPQDSGDVAPFPGPYIESAELDHGGDTVFFVENGAVSCLEIFAYGSAFPERLFEYKLRSVERMTPDESLEQPGHE
jgi:hypothetical protein